MVVSQINRRHVKDTLIVSLKVHYLHLTYSMPHIRDNSILLLRASLLKHGSVLLPTALFFQCMDEAITVWVNTAVSYPGLKSLTVQTIMPEATAGEDPEQQAHLPASWVYENDRKFKKHKRPEIIELINRVC